MRMNNRNGISAIVTVVIIVVVIAVAGVAYFMVLAPSPTSTSSPPSTTTTQSTSSASPTTSSSSLPTTQSTTTSSTTESAVTLPTTSTTEATTSSPTSTTITCTATSYTTTGSAELQQGLAWLFGNFSSMTMQYAENTGSENGTSTIGYSVIYASPTTYKVNFTMGLVSGSTTENFSFLMWMLRNGTILAVDYQGTNMTNGQGVGNYLFLLESETFTASTTAEFTESGYFHVTGAGTRTVTGTSISYTNYEANLLPETVSFCGGSETITKFSLQMGTAANSNYLLIMSMDLGTETAGGPTELIINITQVTVA